MTAQYSETLFLNEKSVSLCTEPLQDYLDSMKNPPEFIADSTACSRGYRGVWVIHNQELFLKEITEYLVEDKTFHWRDLFDGRTGDIKADWYSGILRIPQGELLQYVHAGYASTNQQDLFITIDKGNVIKEEVVTNLVDK